jgi:hypothetical protein
MFAHRHRADASSCVYPFAKLLTTSIVVNIGEKKGMIKLCQLQIYGKAMKTIQGYVTPLPKGEKGCCQVAVVAEGDVEYCVEPRGVGVDLAEHLSEMVEVIGVVIEEPDMPLRIQVRSYTLMEQPDDDAWYS